MNGRIAALILGLLAGFVPSGPTAARPAVLVDQAGRHFTLEALNGTPFVVTFVAAHCTDACPLIEAQFAQAAQALQRERVPVKLLMITLDPQHDPPAVMRQLAVRLHADPRRLALVSGNVPDVRAVMAAFGVVAQQGVNGYADVHTTFIYLIDARGRLRETLLASSALAAQLAGEVHRQWRVLAQ
jgi:protein SCO1/2